MKINLTIEEAKKALQKEAKTVRKQYNLDGDFLKVTCNIKQQARGEFTIYSRDLNATKDIILNLGSKFGDLVEIEKADVYREGRIRFAFKNRPTSTSVEDTGKDFVEPIKPVAPKPEVRKPLATEIYGEVCDVCMAISAHHQLQPEQVYVDTRQSCNGKFVVVLVGTDFCTDQPKLEPLAKLGHLIHVVRLEDRTEYVFALHSADVKPQIKLDLRGVVRPTETPEKATETTKESRPAVSLKPLAEAKKDILKHAERVRKAHGIPGSDFRIICTDIHISLGEFILFTKNKDYSDLAQEFEQFGTIYNTEKAGAGAVRYRFDYKKAQ